MERVAVEITEEMMDAHARCSEDSDCYGCPCQIGTDDCVFNHEGIED